MTTVKFSPALAIVALAGSKEAAHEAAFDSLNKGLLCIIGHGDKRTLMDTLVALGACKGEQGKRVRSMVDAAYTAALQSANMGKGLADKGAALAQAMCDRYARDYITAVEAASEARTGKTAERKLAKEKEVAKAAREAKTSAAEFVPLTIARAAACLQAACMSDSDEAFAAVIDLAKRFCDFNVADEATITPVASVAAAVAMLQDALH